MELPAIDRTIMQPKNQRRTSAVRTAKSHIVITVATSLAFLLWADPLFHCASAASPSRTAAAFVPSSFLSGDGPTRLSAVFASNNGLSSSQQRISLNTDDNVVAVPRQETSATVVAYKEVSLRLPQYNINVPVATWFQPDENTDTMAAYFSQQGKQKQHGVVYSHRISVPRIASLLAGIDFIPEFVSKDFRLNPSISTETSIVIDGKDISFPSGDRPVVILAHGFLGSRFDLSHLAEELAAQGFVCLSPEYPESLASSYTRRKQDNGPDRAAINQELLQAIQMQMNIRASSYGIVGHSLGCGTATSTGDETWTRVCIAGPPVRRQSDGTFSTAATNDSGNVLAIASLNDGLVTRSRLESMIPTDFVRLEEDSVLQSLRSASMSLSSSSSSSSTSSSGGKTLVSLPSKAILVLDRPDAPNHISFLAGNANDAMVSFLSPLLPVAQMLSIPVLDFDKYQVSRDSVATANVVIPLVSAYLRQYMM